VEFQAPPVQSDDDADITGQHQEPSYVTPKPGTFTKAYYTRQSWPCTYFTNKTKYIESMPGGRAIIVITQLTPKHQQEAKLLL